MKKLKIYLDTNMVLDIFTNQTKVLKGEEPKIPKKYEFMLAHMDKFQFVTSILTKAEIVRELTTAFHISVENIEKLWKDFIKSSQCHYIEEFTVGKEFVQVVSDIKMKLRTMMNFQHVFISIRENAYFVSGDKDIIKKIKENRIYDKALTYIELRKLATSLDSSHTRPDA